MRDRSLILVVDDSPADALLLSRILSKAGHGVAVAHDGSAAVEMAASSQPDLILLDMSMPGRDGLETCRILKSCVPTAPIPVIFVTAHSDGDHILRAFAAGGSDYVTKPIRIDEMLARVSVQLRLREAERSLVERNDELEKLAQQLAVTNSELARQSRIDSLTNLYNRRAWDEAAQLEHERSTRHDHAYSVLMLDVDFFKMFNDSQGHQGGDDCLRRVAHCIAASCRATDITGRYGGEEFVVLAPETSAEQAIVLAERIREAVWSAAISHPKSPAGRVTISIGLAGREDAGVEDTLKRADAALYQAKRCGRNLVVGRQIAVPRAGTTVECRGALEAYPSPEALADDTATVVIVDDNRTNRLIYHRCLEKEGYRIVEAEDGQRALEVIGRADPDVILMDVMMPVMDGLECTRRLKADPESRSIPLIIVSARSSAEEVLAGLAAGADEYLTKPIRTTELMFRVRSMARLSRERKDLLRSYRLRAEQIRILSILLDFCHAIGEALTLDEILTHTVNAAAEVATSRRVSAMLPDEDQECLTIASSVGMDPATADKVRVPIGAGIAGRVFSSRRAIVVNRAEEAVDSRSGYDSEFYVSVPILSTPLGTDADVLGVLNVTDRFGGRPFEAHELEYMDLVASIAGSAMRAVRNRRARDEARDLIVVVLARLAEHRDNETARHVERVTQYSRVLGEKLRQAAAYEALINDEFMEHLVRSVPLHDIGKVAIPDSILRKPGKLTVQEMEVMRTHAEIGAETLRPVILKAPEVGFLRMAQDVIHAHHEWYNGAGYPRGLKGVEIPLSARIVAVADVYDALTTERAYKNAIAHEEAVRIIEESSGTQFDPSVVDAFLSCREAIRRLAIELADQRSSRPKTHAFPPQLAPA